VGKSDGYWILPDGRLAASGSSPLASLKEPVDLVLANGPDGLVRTQTGKIEAWGNLASLLNDDDRTLLAEATEVSLLGTKGIGRSPKGDLYGFGGSATVKFSETVAIMDAAGATRFAQGAASGTPMAAFAFRDGSIRLCVDDGSATCGTVYKPLIGVITPAQVVRLQVHSERILVSWDNGTFRVFSAFYTKDAAPSVKETHSGKWASVTPILAGAQQLIEVREGRLVATDLSTSLENGIAQADRAQHLVPGFSSFMMRNADGSVAHFTSSTSGWLAFSLPEWSSK
jgi:hypothetical protein